ncbi:hypothetical protein HELRODRAFT_182422 [Helobdella robusta]|uniref:Uncharacterized protein n=1 Tax=Helobdella robusta TaxID=6412 RepID=T1FI61_HELRO|nr:hypothetical protein HELRODRAFT_182422 [Helobdella robusta]ESN90951.1 hypothetical protein HELRODRAFT_182422 [Helobdella robusta]
MPLTEAEKTMYPGRDSMLILNDHVFKLLDEQTKAPNSTLRNSSETNIQDTTVMKRGLKFEDRLKILGWPSLVNRLKRGYMISIYQLLNGLQDNDIKPDYALTMAT